MRRIVGMRLLLLLVPAVSLARVELTPDIINQPSTEEIGPKSRGPAVLRAQILLDRANFSPGEIDGSYGDNMRRAIAAFQQSRGLAADGVIRPDTWEKLNADTAPAIVSYTIAPEDVAGPFGRVPEDMMAKAKLKTLGYESAQEAIAEKFHVSPKVLRSLNPALNFQAGQQLAVPNVLTANPPMAARVIVSAANSSVQVIDSTGQLVAHYPASTGSAHDPLPVGEWKIQGVQKNPVFHYNPKLFWDADPSHSKAKIQPGPNNPVGVVWIDVSKEHYGIHGTPNPATVGKAQSHGCIRLTNWDAWELAQLVKPGTIVSFVE